MTFPLTYCPHGNEASRRLRALYEDRRSDQICAVMEVPNAALTRFAAEHEGGYCAFPDVRDRIRFWDDYLRERVDVEDDSIPSAYLTELDQGLYGALIGGDVRFLCDPASGWISSMVPPVLRDWSELSRLSLDVNHPWFARYREYLDTFVAAAEGRFGISHFILISGLNFVFELVGATDTYLALSDRPPTVQQAIELGFAVNVAVQEAFFEKTPLLEGGTCSNMVQWVPGRVVSESVDPFHMTSEACFERWGRENVEQIFARFDGGVLHLHANGHHLLERVATLKGLKAVCLMDDRGFEPAFDFLPTARQRAGDLPLVVSAEYGRFCEAISRRELTGGVLYRVRNVPGVADANRVMEQVRSWRG